MKRYRYKHILALVLCAAFFSLPVVPVETEAVSVPVFYREKLPVPDFSLQTRVNAECAFLFAPETNAVLLSQNADKKHGMASTTKIMTAITASELLPPDREIVITEEMCGVEGSSIYLQPGEILTTEQLLYGLMLESGNDAAVALAIASCGSVERFAFLMNVKAALLGCRDTHFTNPHGLSDKEHYTTARELGLITAYALKNDSFRKIVSTYTIRIPYKGTENGRVLVNHNPILRSYEGIFGVKTGWTTDDGKCFVTAAMRDGLTLVAVSLGDTNISATHRRLLDLGFASFETVVPEVQTAFLLPLVGGGKAFVNVRLSSLPAFCVPKGAVVSGRIEAPRFLYAGVREGETVGRVVFYAGETVLGQAELVCGENTVHKRISIWEKVFG